MRVTKLRICLGTGNYDFRYVAETIEDNGQFYYRVGDKKIKITENEYKRVVSNPYLYYFSTALKLHFKFFDK